MSAATVVIVPAALVGELVAGLHHELAAAGAALALASGDPRAVEHPGVCRRPLARLDAARGLLAELRWTADGRPVPVGMAAHGAALITALRGQAIAHAEELRRPAGRVDLRAQADVVHALWELLAEAQVTVARASEIGGPECVA